MSTINDYLTPFQIFQYTSTCYKRLDIQTNKRIMSENISFNPYIIYDDAFITITNKFHRKVFSDKM